MTRKSKQPGGINPLTYREQSRLKSYGTTKIRLSTESQRKFGDCCLSLSPAVDPVATPSGHVYSREAIVSYLLTKTKEYKDACHKYEALMSEREEKERAKAAVEKEQSIQTFHDTNTAAARDSKEAHAAAFTQNLKRKVSVETKQEGRNVLKRTSYWLSEFQPQHKDNDNNLPPARPTSPYSGRTLKLKDLTKLTTLQREKDRCVCAVSGKAITTQAVVAVRGAVMLKDVYEKLAKPDLLCPVTGKKFKPEKHVLQLQKAASGFAASGEVTAKIYRHTMT